MPPAILPQPVWFLSTKCEPHLEFQSPVVRRLGFLVALRPCQGLTDGCACRLRHVNYGSTFIERSRRAVLPSHPGREHGDMIPDDASAIMLAHRTRDQAAFVPVL